MTQATELIPGIYNYCDSWCERCPFTKRCQSFKLQYPEGIPQEDMDAETLVKRLMEALQMTKAYIAKHQKKELPEHMQTALEAKAAGVHETDTLERPSVAALCDQYLNTTASWLKAEMNLLEQAGHQQAFEVNIGVRTEAEAMTMLNGLKDAWEVIKWYRTLIPVKVMSALQLRRAPTNDPQLSAYFNGKAKLVLVSVDKSLAAWHTLLEHYPEKMDEVLDMLVLLDRIRRQMTEQFPQAREFRRPGLD
ncbi:hypothetical protein [Tellurirhabdus rosea]|uniref:hypothetical protein n=1 Tax=Tellurirhabdus rosea TaxID=2674997 RepID=UPI0022551947|nr:hypothetical protein [Tellurirhabdus rosea]